MWVCKERRKGKKGNGCKNRNVNEEELLKAIYNKLDLSRECTEDFCREEFERKIDKVIVYDDRFEFIEKNHN